MFALIIDVLIILLVLLILFSKKNYPLIWSVIALYIFNFRIKFFGIIPISYLIPFVMFISLYIQDYKFVVFKKFPLKYVFILYLFGVLLLGLFDLRLSLLDRFAYPLKYILETSLLLFCSFFFTLKMRNDNLLINVLSSIIIIITSYGVYEFITMTNPIKFFIDSLYLDDSYFQNLNYDKEILFNRYIGFSIFNFSYNFAFAASAIGLYSLYLYKLRKKTKYIIFTLMGILCCFFSGSRSSLIAYLISSSFFIIKAYEMKKVLKLLIFIIPALLLLILVIPIFSTFFEGVLGIFTGNSDFTGSSIDMRQSQFNAVLELFKQSPIIGNGLFYFKDVVGFGTYNAKSYGVYGDLIGLEGYFMMLLLEQGILGVTIALVFFVSLYRYLKKSYNTDYSLSILGISFIILFLVFSNATGTLSSWVYTMLFLGIIIGKIEIKKYK